MSLYLSYSLQTNTAISLANAPHRNITVAQTYTPPKLDGVLQQSSGGYSLSSAPSNDVNQVRHRQSRPANERPSPVAFDGGLALVVMIEFEL